MTAPVTIPAGPPADPAQDYAALRQLGIAACQRLSGDIWTDYNEHDPGVTTLEQLCYALTELAYRAKFPVAELLARGTDGVEPRRQGLMVARRGLPCNPVTPDDYRRLMIDRVPGVANAWFTPVPPTADVPAGLYDAFLYVPGQDPCRCEDWLRPEAILPRARRVYARHRGLCEDLRCLTLLAPLPVTVGGDIDVADGMSACTILAGILFHVGLTLAPEPRRTSLAEAMAAGSGPNQVFEGPLMLHGSIAAAELKAKPDTVSVPDVVTAIARSPGVIGARNVKVWVGSLDSEPLTGTRSCPVAPDQIAQLDRQPCFKGGFQLRLWRRGIECVPDPARVRDELDRMQREWRQPHPLSADYARLFPVPKTRERRWRQYTAIATQYPITYGIGPYGLPWDASPQRRAQAKQLKGYLMAFDQLLADFFAQLDRAKDLFALAPQTPATYFWQSIWDIVPGGAEDLLGPRASYEAAMAQLTAATDPRIRRRNRFLDVLLALYAEEITADSHIGRGCAGGVSGADDEQLLLMKERLLRAIVPVTRDRARGFDYLARPSARNASGLWSRLCIALGRAPVDVDAPPFVIEHLLLRPAARFIPSFTVDLTVTVVMEDGDPGTRAQAQEAVRAATPAHIAAHCIFLPPAVMALFIPLYAAWRDCLRESEGAVADRAPAADLLSFLAGAAGW